MSGVIDVHVHIAGTGTHSNCFVSEKLKNSPSYYLMLTMTGHIFQDVNDETIRKHLLDVLGESDEVDRAVFLALDQVYDRHGNPDRDQTHLHTPNDYVADLAAREEKVLFGASVHPDRKDALDELDRVVEQGAVLLKWIPSSQNINPRRGRYRPFYRKLAELELPLLCHVGAEHAVPAPEPEDHYRKFDQPDRLVPALEAGVKVIAAHCCTPVFSWDPDYFDDFIALMHRSDEEQWGLYADVSALVGPFPHRVELLKRVVTELPHERLILGSDYPIPVSPLWPGAADEIDFQEWAGALLTTNPLDRNVKMIRALGFNKQVLTSAEKVLHGDIK